MSEKNEPIVVQAIQQSAINPSYQGAIDRTAEHYQVMVAFVKAQMRQCGKALIMVRFLALRSLLFLNQAQKSFADWLDCDQLLRLSSRS